MPNILRAIRLDILNEVSLMKGFPLIGIINAVLLAEFFIVAPWGPRKGACEECHRDQCDDMGLFVSTSNDCHKCLILNIKAIMNCSLYIDSKLSTISSFSDHGSHTEHIN